MTFARDDHWVWDFWLARTGQVFHLFYLHAPRSLGDPGLRHRNAAIGHATSRDLRHWADEGSALGPGGPGDFDETATWTGSVVQGPDGVWRMFYTGARFPSADSRENVETIGVATSADLATWTKAPGPVVAADPRWYETLPDRAWHEEAWRDPWVFPDPGGRGWHMLITARSWHGDPLDRGVLAHATSPDLDTWTAANPLSAPGAGFAHLETPQLVTIDGRHAVLFSCDTAHVVGARRARGEEGGIWAVATDDPAGPIRTENAVRVTGDDLYCGRAVRDDAGRWVLLAFENTGADTDFIGRISDPLPLSWSAGGELAVLVEDAAR